VGAGDIGVYYLQEPISQIGEGSAVQCWVDDNYGGAKVLENAADVADASPKYVFYFTLMALVDDMLLRLVMIDQHVTRGSHFVECLLLGEEGRGVPMFKIIGIFSS
jgi:hypothetical protein